MKLTSVLAAALAAAAIAGCGGGDSPQTSDTATPAPTKEPAKKPPTKGEGKAKKTPRPKDKATPGPTKEPAKKPPTKDKGKVTITATPEPEKPETGGPDETNRLPVSARITANGISFSPASVPAGRPLKFKIKSPKRTSLTVESSTEGRLGSARVRPKRPTVLVLPRLKAGTLEFKAGKVKASLPVG